MINQIVNIGKDPEFALPESVGPTPTKSDATKKGNDKTESDIRSLK
jgi:hypothetical protein